VTDALTTAGELVAAEVERIWRDDIIDPASTDTSPNGLRCREFISSITQACKWGPYLGNNIKPVAQWCGMFAFKAWADAGGLDPKWLAHFSQSTYRIQCWATYRPFNEHRNASRPIAAADARLCVDLRSRSKFPVRRGDIVIVGDGHPPYGDHATIATGTDELGGIITISGNGRGLDPTGNSQEGVVRKTFYPGLGVGYRAMYLVRPSFDDLLAERN